MDHYSWLLGIQISLCSREFGGANREMHSACIGMDDGR